MLVCRYQRGLVMLCSKIIENVNSTINDPSNVSFSLSRKIDVLNEGIKAVVLIRPESSSVYYEHQVQDDTKQTLPSDCFRLLRVIRNINGTTKGKSIRKMDLDRVSDRVVDWHFSDSASEALEYAYDNTIQNVFWVYPKLQDVTNRKIELVYQKNVQEVSSTSDAFPINDAYSVAVQEWMLYLLWGGEDEQSATYNKALKRYESFFNLLGIKKQADDS